uniref:Uncharacterized protein n=1 Tax=Seriola lalandi dorsalis TaxID=1841481 RepID=A0A3B4XRH4_SERLL
MHFWEIRKSISSDHFFINLSISILVKSAEPECCFKQEPESIASCLYHTHGCLFKCLVLSNTKGNIPFVIISIFH